MFVNVVPATAAKLAAAPMVMGVKLSATMSEEEWERPANWVVRKARMANLGKDIMKMVEMLLAWDWEVLQVIWWW